MQAPLNREDSFLSGSTAGSRRKKQKKGSSHSRKSTSSRKSSSSSTLRRSSSTSRIVEDVEEPSALDTALPPPLIASRRGVTDDDVGVRPTMDQPRNLVSDTYEEKLRRKMREFDNGGGGGKAALPAEAPKPKLESYEERFAKKLLEDEASRRKRDTGPRLSPPVEAPKPSTAGSGVGETYEERAARKMAAEAADPKRIGSQSSSSSSAAPRRMGSQASSSSSTGPRRIGSQASSTSSTGPRRIGSHSSSSSSDPANHRNQQQPRLAPHVEPPNPQLESLDDRIARKMAADADSRRVGAHQSSSSDPAIRKQPRMAEPMEAPNPNPESLEARMARKMAADADARRVGAHRSTSSDPANLKQPPRIAERIDAPNPNSESLEARMARKMAADADSRVGAHQSSSASDPADRKQPRLAAPIDAPNPSGVGSMDERMARKMAADAATSHRVGAHHQSMMSDPALRKEAPRLAVGLEAPSPINPSYDERMERKMHASLNSMGGPPRRTGPSYAANLDSYHPSDAWNQKVSADFASQGHNSDGNSYHSRLSMEEHIQRQMEISSRASLSSSRDPRFRGSTFSGTPNEYLLNMQSESSLGVPRDISMGGTFRTVSRNSSQSGLTVPSAPATPSAHSQSLPPTLPSGQLLHPPTSVAKSAPPRSAGATPGAYQMEGRAIGALPAWSRNLRRQLSHTFQRRRSSGGSQRQSRRDFDPVLPSGLDQSQSGDASCPPELRGSGNTGSTELRSSNNSSVPPELRGSNNSNIPPELRGSNNSNIPPELRGSNNSSIPPELRGSSNSIPPELRGSSTMGFGMSVGDHPNGFMHDDDLDGRQESYVHDQSPDGLPERPKDGCNRTTWTVIGVIVLLLAVGGGVGAGLALTRGAGGSKTEPSAAPTPDPQPAGPPSAAPSFASCNEDQTDSLPLIISSCACDGQIKWGDTDTATAVNDKCRDLERELAFILLPKYLKCETGGASACDIDALTLSWLANDTLVTEITDTSRLANRYFLAHLFLTWSEGQPGRWGVQSLLSSSDECSWLGVTCDKDSNIIGLDLRGLRLEAAGGEDLGWAPTLFEINSLQKLVMRDTYLNAKSIPTAIAKLSKLEQLTISPHRINWNLPNALFRLTGLKILELVGDEDSDLMLEGILPTAIDRLVALERLVLQNSRLGGNIPTQLGNLPKLKELTMARSRFTGTIPTTLGDIFGLESLHLGRNSLIGTIPTELGLLRNLSKIDLFQNDLTGEIPPGIGNGTLVCFEARGNKLGGTLDSGFCSTDPTVYVPREVKCDCCRASTSPNTACSAA